MKTPTAALFGMASITREKPKITRPIASAPRIGNSRGCMIRPRIRWLYSGSSDARSDQAWTAHSMVVATSTRMPPTNQRRS